MKAYKFSAILLGCVMMLGFASCVEKAPEYVPGEAEITNGAFFLATDKAAGINPDEFTVKNSDTEFTYWVGRSNPSGDCTVNIINNSDARFTVPATVTFANGEKKAPLTVKFSALPEENCYVSFKIADEAAAIYGAGTSEFSGALNCTPFHKLILGTYTSGPVDSYFGDIYQFNFTIVANPEDEDHKSVIIQNLDPFFFGNGYTAAKGYNTVVGFIDESTSTIIVPSGQRVGYSNVVFQGFDDPDPDVADFDDYIYLVFDSGTITFKNAWGVTGWYAIYYGGTTVTKK